MPRVNQDAPLQTVLVEATTDVDIDSEMRHWHRGDGLLLAAFSLVGASLLGLSLVPGFESMVAEECTANATCTYEEGFAFSTHADSIASWVSGGKEGCCSACRQHAGCVAGVFVNNATTTPANCFMYTKSMGSTVALAGASLCSLTSDGDGAVSTIRAQLETLLGAAAVLMRFGGFALVYVLKTVSECAGYDGAGLVKSVLSPRQAGAASAHAASFHEPAALVPPAAGWEAIASIGMASGWFPLPNRPDRILGPPSTWTEARTALGLSVRQAVWSSGTKMLLWHWSQPLAYFAVFGVYYCVLPDEYGNGKISLSDRSQRGLGTIVAVREVLYVLQTLLALWLNPSFLLLELGGVLRPAVEGEAWCRRLDGDSLKRWFLYLLVPQHYVALCLVRWARSVGRVYVEFLLYIVGVYQFGADFCSGVALMKLLVLPSPPVALGIGYWLTTVSVVLGIGWSISRLLNVWWNTARMALTRAGAAPRLCCLCSCLYIAPMLWFQGLLLLLIAPLLVLAPLQLFGVVSGLAPPCDSPVWLYLDYCG